MFTNLALISVNAEKPELKELTFLLQIRLPNARRG